MQGKPLKCVLILSTIVLGMSTHSGLGNLLFGRTRGAILALLYGKADHSFYTRQIAREVDASVGAVQRELENLSSVGLIIRSSVGSQVFYQANRHASIFREMQALVNKTIKCGSLTVLKFSTGQFAGKNLSRMSSFWRFLSRHSCQFAVAPLVVSEGAGAELTSKRDYLLRPPRAIARHLAPIGGACDCLSLTNSACAFKYACSFSEVSAIAAIRSSICRTRAGVAPIRVSPIRGVTFRQVISRWGQRRD